MDLQEIHSVLNKLGERVPKNSELILLGGSALALLGNSRLTIDIDFWGDDLNPTEQHQALLRVAKEFDFDIEPVPLDRFIPLPDGSSNRSIHIGSFGNLEVFVADPYCIALSKLDRGFDTDLGDIVFLIQNRYIEFDRFERVIQDTLPLAGKYDFQPGFLDHFQELKRRLG